MNGDDVLGPGRRRGAARRGDTEGTQAHDLYRLILDDPALLRPHCAWLAEQIWLRS